MARPHQGIAQRIPNGEDDRGLLAVADLDREGSTGNPSRAA
jgi:hypothetical protein